ncbi:Thiamine pyrophosphokinase [Golovinomyces cichoracearum]|uniref:Thiamine pyrophosphokinase n=1 Tax=Golovinomyces cichoracearum TaxID=62708 RepID=A0A420IC81_9PEZI|nr:Thiamine pyrophosphokinase [Golovinomyces cichoracearum]
MNESSEITVWEPSALLFDQPKNDRYALVILNRALDLPVSLYTKLWSNAVYKVAADGGANHLHNLNSSISSTNLNLDLDVIIGDLDSILPYVRAHWEERKVSFIYDPDQNSTDFAKAVKYIRNCDKKEPIDIVILSDLSGRVDQAMSILHHLYALQAEIPYTSGRLYFLSNEAITFTLLSGKHSIRTCRSLSGDGLGKYVGIIPLRGPSMISTSGLEWDVHDWKTEFGGQMSTSNHVKSDLVSIQTTKDVLFTINLDLERQK